MKILLWRNKIIIIKDFSQFLSQCTFSRAQAIGNINQDLRENKLHAPMIIQHIASGDFYYDFHASRESRKSAQLFLENVGCRKKTQRRRLDKY